MDVTFWATLLIYSSICPTSCRHYKSKIFQTLNNPKWLESNERISRNSNGTIWDLSTPNSIPHSACSKHLKSTARVLAPSKNCNRFKKKQICPGDLALLYRTLISSTPWNRNNKKKTHNSVPFQFRRMPKQAFRSFN